MWEAQKTGFDVFNPPWKDNLEKYTLPMDLKFRRRENFQLTVGKL